MKEPQKSTYSLLFPDIWRDMIRLRKEQNEIEVIIHWKFDWTTSFESDLLNESVEQVHIAKCLFPIK